MPDPANRDPHRDRAIEEPLGMHGRQRPATIYLGAILLMACALQLGFLVAVTGSDSLGYAATCRSIADGTFHLAKPNLYCTRWLFMYPPALLFRWFGAGELTAAAYPMTCSLGVLLLTYLIGRRLYSANVGLLAAALLAICPIFVIKSTSLLPDIPLAFYATLSVYLFLVGDSSLSKSRWLLFFGSGVALAAGWLVKETIVVLPLFYGVFLLWNWRRLSPSYALVLVAAGFVFLCECATYGWLTGNPLFRLESFMSPVEIAKSAQYMGSRWDYLRKMFISVNEFGFLFYLLLGALVYAVARRRKDMITPVLWFFTLFLYINFGTFSLKSWNFIWTNARYLMPALVPACLLVAFWMYNAVRITRPWVYYLALALLAASSFEFTCIDYGKAVGKRDGLKWVCQWLAERPSGTVYLDGEPAGLLSFYSTSNPPNRPWAIVDLNNSPPPAKATDCYVVIVAPNTRRPDDADNPRLPGMKAIPANWRLAVAQTVTSGGLADAGLSLVNQFLTRLPVGLAKTLSPRGDDWKHMPQGSQVTIYYISNEREVDPKP